MTQLLSILLPTYNGRRYLPELLKSLLAQTYPDVAIRVHDDGSTDDTYSFLRSWAAGRSNVHLTHGENRGVARSFFRLLGESDAESEYFAFCDQDDVWLPDKLERAVKAIRHQPADEPVMYCSRIELVDMNLRHLAYSRVLRRMGFANALVENVATGCTMVLNRGARDLVCQRLPQRAVMHDWWCYMVLSAFGRVIYDERPSVKYRQHGNNVFGAASSRAGLFKRRLLRFLKLPRSAKLFGDWVEEFGACHREALGPEHKAIFDRFLTIRGNLWDRLSYSVAMDVWRQWWVDTMILRALILMGRV